MSTSLESDPLLVQAALHRAEGRVHDAEAAYRELLARNPGHPAALHDLGLLIERPGRRGEALHLLLESVRACPESPEYCADTAAALSRVGRRDEAAAMWDNVCRLRPHSADAHFRRGRAYAELNRLDEAIRSLSRATELDPSSEAARVELAGAQCRRGGAELPVLPASPAGTDDAEDAATFLAAGHALRERRQWDAAATAFRAAVRMDPNSAEGHYWLGRALDRGNHFGEAVGAFERALSLRPEWAQAHRDLGLVLLRAGDTSRGWSEFEWRLKVEAEDAERVARLAPNWDGSDLTGRRVLLVCEGTGADAIRFVRYAAALAERGATVVVECPRPLRPLLASAPGVAGTVARDDRPPAVDFAAWAMSLPRRFGAPPDSPAARPPYLRPDPGRKDDWARKMGEGFKIGIVWHPHPSDELAAERAIPLHHFSAVAACPGVKLVSLQVGAGTEQLVEGRSHMTLGVFDPALDVGTGGLDDTAAVVSSLDLVIAADTTITDLAGALGVPCWVGVPRVSDWRWPPEGERSEWYPTVRLFRQRRRGDWGEVMQRVAGALRQLRGTAVGPARD